MNAYKFFIMLCLSLLMTGCATATFDKFAGNGYNEQVVVEDEIIAIGKPSRPITNYENDLLLVGKKYGYLATVIEPKNKQLFKQVFSGIDLQALTLDTGRLYTNELTYDMDVRLYGSSYENCPTKYGCYRLDILFDKPINKVQLNEKQRLKSLGFNCWVEKDIFSCSQKVRVGLTPTNKVNNFDKLKHKLKHPIDLKITKLIKNKGIPRPLYYAILPLTMTFDVITLPIQCDMSKNCSK